MARWLKERATPEVHGTFERGGATRALNALMGDEPVRAPVRVRTATLPDGTVIAEAELRMRARGSEGDGHLVLFAYRKAEAGWLLDRIPEALLEPPPVRAVAPHAAVVRAHPLDSPVLVLRHFPAGGIPPEVREQYAAYGVALPEDGAWSDAVVRGEPLHYPGCDTLGRTDPWAAPGTPDAWARLEQVVREQWWPQLALLEDDDGTGLSLDPVTIDAVASTPAELLAGALRVFARERTAMPEVRLRVAQAPGFVGVSELRLLQPRSPADLDGLPTVPAGLTGEALRQALLEQGLTEDVGVLPTAGATVQAVVATVDALVELGYEDICLVVLQRD
jgi:hypothetical protein